MTHRFADVTRVSALRGLAASLALTLPVATEAAEPAANALSPDDAVARLASGNTRYRLDAAINCNKNFNRRSETASAQSPFAIVLGCADSRVPPEVIFDQRLGDLFVVRVAGNVADDIAIGSIEYAVEHFHSPLVLVLGHEKCGAVTATLDALQTGTTVPGFIGRIVESISPAAARALGLPGDRLAAAVRFNVADVVRQLRARSTVVAQAESAGALRVLGATYDLASGGVDYAAATPAR